MFGEGLDCRMGSMGVLEDTFAWCVQVEGVGDVKVKMRLSRGDCQDLEIIVNYSRRGYKSILTSPTQQ